MPDLAALNYAPLKVHVSTADLHAFRSAREVLGYDEAAGFDEQKAAVTSRDDTGLWERRFRLAAFAQANGMTYSFRSDPARWPGQLPTSCTMDDVLEGRTESGQRFMACAMKADRAGDLVGSKGFQEKHFVVMAVEVGTDAPSVYLEHNWVRHPDSAHLLADNYRLRDDLYTAEDKGAGFSSARALFTNAVLEPVVKRTRGYDLFLAGGWLYLLKDFDFGAIQKKHAEPDILRERFELAAAVGPTLLASAKGRAERRLADARQDQRPSSPVSATALDSPTDQPAALIDAASESACSGATDSDR